jgi:hypothetical protein
MRSSLNLIYQLLHKDYPESFSDYAPKTKDFYDSVYSQLPESWNIQRGGMWFYCSPPAYTPPLQGWKIDVSVTVENCRCILDSITSVLIKYDDASFKFALDRSLLSLLNSKEWPRAESGKFITIYPRDAHRFLELIAEIDHATAGMKGHYILSGVFEKFGRKRAGNKKSHASVEHGAQPGPFAGHITKQGPRHSSEEGASSQPLSIGPL